MCLIMYVCVVFLRMGVSVLCFALIQGVDYSRNIHSDEPRDAFHLLWNQLTQEVPTFITHDYFHSATLPVWFCPWSADFHTLLCFCKLDGCRPPKLADKPSDENLTGWREVKLSAGFFPFPSLRLDAGQAPRHWPHLDEYAARHKRAKERDGRSGRARKGALPIRSLALHTLGDDVEITAPNH